MMLCFACLFDIFLFLKKKDLHLVKIVTSTFRHLASSNYLIYLWHRKQMFWGQETREIGITFAFTDVNRNLPPHYNNQDG